MARLGPILGRISPPPGGPGRLQEVIFGRFWDVPAEILKLRFCLSFFSHIWGLFFCAIICPLLSSLLRGWRRRAYAKKLNIHCFLWVASHMRLVLATPEAINFQGGRVINIGGKKSSKKGPTGPENKIDKRAFLKPKRLPKWTPEASRNVCTRRSATEAAKNASWGAPRAPPDDFGAIFLLDRYPRLSSTPNFAHLGPWERTIIKEIDLKQLKHRIRHASGRWPGEFLGGADGGGKDWSIERLG